MDSCLFGFPNFSFKDPWICSPHWGDCHGIPISTKTNKTNLYIKSELTETPLSALVNGKLRIVYMTNQRREIPTNISFHSKIAPS
jgi:hypothetical protein